MEPLFGASSQKLSHGRPSSNSEGGGSGDKCDVVSGSPERTLESRRRPQKTRDMVGWDLGSKTGSGDYRDHWFGISSAALLAFCYLVLEEAHGLVPINDGSIRGTQLQFGQLFACVGT